MAASVTGQSTNTGGAAATATVLLTFAQTVLDNLYLWVRGSANASATVANVYDDSGGAQVATGTPTATVIQMTGAAWTTDQWAGYTLTNTGSATADFHISRVVVSNTSNTLTTATWPNVPASGTTYVLGNTWSTLTPFTIDGGAATSHALWAHATGVLAASSSAVTVTVVWGGGNTAFTVGAVGVNGMQTGSAPEVVGTVTNGNSAAPIAGSVVAAGGGILLLGVSAVTTAMTFTNQLDNSSGSSLSQLLPASGTSRILVADRIEAAGTYAARATMSGSEGWTTGAIFVPDPTVAFPAGRITHQGMFEGAITAMMR